MSGVSPVDVDAVRTVCLMLGPYRNLTTLTAAIVGLHPNCQVLNHGGMQVFRNNTINFLGDYSDERFEAFIRFAVGASAGGERGQHGGSITRSHAFGPRFRTAEIYRQRYGEQLVKDEIHSVFWKESYRTTRFIRENQVDLPALLTRNEKLRFLMPIRYPLDCARSSLKSGHAIAFVDEDEPQPMRPLVAAILDQIVWFFQWQDRFPDRFFWFSENGFEQSTVEALAAFLSVDAEPRWCDSALDAFEVERRYEYRPAMIEYYHQTVQDKLGDRPQIAERLMKMAAGRARGE